MTDSLLSDSIREWGLPIMKLKLEVVTFNFMIGGYTWPFFYTYNPHVALGPSAGARCLGERARRDYAVLRVSGQQWKCRTRMHNAHRWARGLGGLSWWTLQCKTEDSPFVSMHMSATHAQHDQSGLQLTPSRPYILAGERQDVDDSPHRVQ